MIYEISIEDSHENSSGIRDKLSHLSDATMTQWAHLHAKRTHFVPDAMLAANIQMEEFCLGLV
jgi:hypothetical protein